MQGKVTEAPNQALLGCFSVEVANAQCKGLLGWLRNWLLTAQDVGR